MIFLSYPFINGRACVIEVCFAAFKLNNMLRFSAFSIARTLLYFLIFHRNHSAHIAFIIYQGFHMASIASKEYARKRKRWLNRKEMI